MPLKGRSHSSQGRLPRHACRLSLGVAPLVGLFIGTLISPLTAAPRCAALNPKQAQERQPAASSPRTLGPLVNWASQEVPFIITEDEREQFTKLKTESERRAFIKEFWERRNPDPGRPENKFKREYYRRLEYVKQHFNYLVPGPIDDRARIYILFGPPDEIRVLRTGVREGTSRAREGKPSKLRVERWVYHSMAGVGSNITVEFIDPFGTGERKVVIDPVTLIDHTPHVGPPCASGFDGFVAVQPSRIDAPAGDAIPCTCSTQYADVAAYAIRSSSNTSVASVTRTFVTGVSVGTATITAADGTGPRPCRQ